MRKAFDRQGRRRKAHRRIRSRFSGTAQRPRICVYKSLRYLYAQAIDDQAGTVLATASTLEKDLRGAGKGMEAAKQVGSRLGQKLKDHGITQVVYDRNGYPYHGRVSALADALREQGVQF